MDIYREEILEHWRSPDNFGVMDKPDVVIGQINPLCGDQVTFYFKLSRGPVSGFHPASAQLRTKTKVNGNSRGNLRAVGNPPTTATPFVADVSFVGNGCAISIASASILAEFIKGKSIKYLSKITGADVLDLIGGSRYRLRSGGQAVIPPARLKCAFLPLEAIKKLVNDKHSVARR